VSVAPVVLGAPGVIYVPDVAPRLLVGVPMDVVAFVGVAPRGPAWELADPRVWPVPDGVVRTRSVPVAVESWDDYVEHFGSFEGPGLLPYAVASFFQQGGRRAWVVRVVADQPGVTGGAVAPPARSGYAFGPVLADVAAQPVTLTARNEGTWGDRLTITLSFVAVPVSVTSSLVSALALGSPGQVRTGDWLRLVQPGGTRQLRSVVEVSQVGRGDGPGSDWVAHLDGPAGAPVLVDRVDGVLDVIDRDPRRSRREHFEGLGFWPAHPNWIGDVVSRRSSLVELSGDPAGIVIRDVTLAPATAGLTVHGVDRDPQIAPADFFGTWLLGDDSATDGLDVLARVEEVATVVVPDLYCPTPLPTATPVFDPPTLAGPIFAECLPLRAPVPVTPPPPGLTGLALDPADAAQLELIIGLQQQVVAYAESLQLVALLDVPPGLAPRAVLSWRSRFDSAWAAASHPWLRVPLGDGSAGLVSVNPSAAAAGILARTEQVHGVPHGPANEPVVGAVDVTDRVDQVHHDQLHQAGIDVYRMQPDGVWLTGARTLSGDPAWRQLSVRRLVSWLERTVRQELAWTVFEPNDRVLRSRLELLLNQLLARMFALGAFAGATPAQSWFVRTVDAGGLPTEVDAGQLLCWVGVAPAEPVEFIIVCISLDGQGAVRTETFRG
jgi:uncharacterized protein